MVDKSLGKVRFLSLYIMGCWCEVVQHDRNNNRKKEKGNPLANINGWHKDTG
jgi:hypothetical protein